MHSFYQRAGALLIAQLLFLELAAAFTHPPSLSPNRRLQTRTQAQAQRQERHVGSLRCSAQPGKEAAAAAAGLVANPVVWASLVSVKMNGGGLPAGPYGLLGALEGVSYLVVVGFVGTALYKKATTGSALPAGPGGLLGAAEGLSFLSVVGGAIVLLLLIADQGCVPNALPLVDYSAYVTVCH